MNGMSRLVEEFLELINVKSIEMMGVKLVSATVVLVVALCVSRTLQRVIDRRMRHDDQDDEAVVGMYKTVVRSIVMVPGILLAVHVVGVDLSSLFTAGGLVAVALAFAMKNVAENYVSGLMLRFERTIKPGDVLETEGIMVRVKSIGFRATVARSKDEGDLVIPNSQLVQNKVANFTYRDSLYRLETIVGVDYASDLKRVKAVLEAGCRQLDWASAQHKPTVILAGFGDSAVLFKIRAWVDNPWDAGRRQAQLNEAIWWSLKEAGIAMAFPQLDVHFDEALTKAWSVQGPAVENRET